SAGAVVRRSGVAPVRFHRGRRRAQASVRQWPCRLRRSAAARPEFAESPARRRAAQFRPGGGNQRAAGAAIGPEARDPPLVEGTALITQATGQWLMVDAPGLEPGTR